jgi:hypothetical protein
MIKIPIKPLSVNGAWKGKRYKSKDYSVFERNLLLILPKVKMPDPPYEIHYEFGFSSRASDVDNPTKTTTDVLAKKYGFNDKLVHRMILEKQLVKKGAEYIKFKILHYENRQTDMYRDG